MARLQRKGRVLKWAGLIVSLLIGVSWGVSLRWDWGYVAERGSRYDGFGVFIGGSSLKLFHMPSGPPGQRRWVAWPARPFEWKPEYLRASGLTRLGAPLWILFLLVAIPTAYLWWRDRRRIPPGHCQKCGYDLTGNVSGVCPERGEKIALQRPSTGA